jgi:surfeit locus 1 family protein
MHRWWPLGVSLLLAGVGIAAGVWQTGRGHAKEMLRDRYEAMLRDAPVTLDAASRDGVALDLRRVTVRGHWLSERTVFLDNRVLHGRAGFHVLTPLRIEGSERLLLVNRGWVAVGADRAQLPPVPTPADVVGVEGVARTLPATAFRLGEDAPGSRIWQAVEAGRVAQAFGPAMLPLLVQQTSDSADGLVREWDRPDFGIDKHRGYALQWFALALASVVFAGLFIHRQLRPRHET